ncbi:MAG: PfkB family carbohydrate kinase [Spirochaeta sp.]|nr:PfkB family carbohydrate kinase [Spirochaeta sp.]
MESSITPSGIDSLLAALPSASIAVVGDVCLDVYKFLADESEISVETGLPTRIVESMRSSLGGAANVAANLASLGVGEVALYGIIGDDLYGREIVEHCRQAGIRTRGLVVQSEGWNTNVYTKLYKDETEEPRIDLGTLNAADTVSVGLLLELLQADFPSFDAVIINQQLRNGIHTPAFRAGLVALIADDDKLPVFLDSRDYAEEFPRTIHKLNLREAQAVLGRAEDACTAALVLSERWQQTVYLTRGEEGCVVAEEGKAKALPAPATAGMVDPVGAGDSMIAGIVAARVTGLDSVRAAVFGALVAGVTVRKLLRTGTARPEEVREIGRSPDYLYNPELAHSPHKARYIDTTDIELVTDTPQAAFAFAVFDHDGTISTVREGWEQVMEPLMS